MNDTILTQIGICWVYLNGQDETLAFPLPNNRTYSTSRIITPPSTSSFELAKWIFELAKWIVYS